jgi:hypothetical protein
MIAKNPKQYCRQLEDALVDAVSRLRTHLFYSTNNLSIERCRNIGDLVAEIQKRRAKGEDIEFEEKTT